jgi:DNA (cytosine-5)-methyltransferase 1
MRRHHGLTFASLFSGCGGFDLGFIQAGFRCVGAFDIDPLAIQHHTQNLDASAAISDLSHEMPLARSSAPDVLVAGPPCQGFSLAGKREHDDPRNKLLILAAHAARQLRPPVLLVENVAGVRAGSHGRYWEALHEIMRTAGYQTRDFVLIGSDWGVPQMRKRCLFIAWTTGQALPHTLVGSPGGVLRDALKNLRGVPNHQPRLIPSSTRAGMIAQRIKPGQKLCNVRLGHRSVHTWQIPEVYGSTTQDERKVLETLVRVRRTHRARSHGDADPVALGVMKAQLGSRAAELLASLVSKGFVRKIGQRFDLANTFNGKFRRLEWNRPSFTVDTRFGEPGYFLHPSEDRGFTVREAARIQGFPDSFRFFGDTRGQYRLIGNAVPPPMAHSIAQIVKSVLLV